MKNPVRKTKRSRLSFVILGVIVLASCSGCPKRPVPQVTIGTATTARNAVAVRATITPSACSEADGAPAGSQPADCEVTNVFLEYGARPGANNGVNLLFTTQPGATVPVVTVNLGRNLTTQAGAGATLPRAEAFNVTFGPIAIEPNINIVDYQFKVVHRVPGQGEMFFWSERRSLNVGPAVGNPPTGPIGGGGGNNACADPIVNVTRPANGISGGTTTDLGGSAPVISADGRFVAFVSRTKFDANAADVDQIYRRDLQTGAVVAVTRPANAIGGGSIEDRGGRAPSISADGQRVAFVTRTAFDPNAAANVDQIYVRDLANGSILRVTTPSNGISGGTTTDLGGSAPVISADGRFVAFVSRTKFDANAADVDQIYRRDLQTGAIVAVTRPANAIGGGSIEDRGGRAPSISADGARVAFVTRTAFDPNAVANIDQIYVRDLANASILRVTTPANGISGGTTTDLGGSAPVISADGRFVVFVSRTKFDANAADVDQIYRRELQTSTIVAVTRPANAIGGGSIEDRGGRAPSISADGARVAFVTRTAFDPNAVANIDQIYVRDLANGSILRVTTPANGISGGSTTDRGGVSPVISGNGLFVPFVTRTQFDANAPTNVDEVYRRCLPQ